MPLMGTEGHRVNTNYVLCFAVNTDYFPVEFYGAELQFNKRLICRYTSHPLKSCLGFLRV